MQKLAGPWLAGTTLRDLNDGPPLTRVPTPVDAYVGRAHDLHRLRRALASDARVVTLLGPGGVGKTRLVLEWSRDIGREHVAWCDLSAAHTADDVDAAVRCGLGVQRASTDLAMILRGRGPILLILDNFEQLELEASRLVARLIRLAPDARVLATSRRPLGVTGEALVPLDVLNRAEAIELFTLRARALRNSFGQRADELERLPELVDRLDRLPLAIELTAARIRQLSVPEILTRLEERLALLVRKRWHGSARHASLEAALRWSWDLLGRTEREVLRQCSVFRGGFDVDAAECVVRIPDRRSVADQLRLLQRHSLLTAGLRPRLLVSIREFAAERLAEAPEVARAAADRHARCFARRGEPVRYFTPEAPAELRALSPDRENLAAAVEHALATEQAELAARCLEPLTVLAIHRGHVPSMIPLHERVLAMPSLPADRWWRMTAQRVQCLKIVGRIDDAHDAVEEALARDGGPADMRIALQLNRGGLKRNLGRLTEARACLLEGLELAERHGHRYGECSMAAMLSRLYIADDEEELAQRAVAVAMEVGAPEWEAYARVGLGRRWVGVPGRTREAEAELRRAVALCREASLGLSEASNLNNLASILLVRTGPFSEGLELLERSVRLHRAGGNRVGEGLALGNLGMTYVAVGRMAEGEAALWQAERLVAENSPSQHGDLLRYLGILFHETGRNAEAVAILQRSIERCVECGGPVPEAIARCLLASLLADELGDAVIEQIDLGLRRVEGQSLQQHRATAMKYAGKALMQLGRLGEAQTMVETAARLMNEHVDRYGLVELASVRAELAMKRGRPEQAEALLAAMGADLEMLGLGPSSAAGRRRAELVGRVPRRRRASGDGFVLPSYTS